MWFAERGEWDDEAGIWVRPDGNESPYASIPVGMWWALVTFTTVGYGDMAPITPWGQFFGVMAMMAGGCDAVAQEDPRALCVVGPAPYYKIWQLEDEADAMRLAARMPRGGGCNHKYEFHAI